MSAATSSLQFPSDLEITMERVFNAPRALVWQAYTEREHLQNWWGLRANSLRIEAHDLRPGGAWRYVEISPDGTQHAFYGVFQEITPIERFAYTFEYEPWAGHVCVDTVTLHDMGAQTRVHTHTLYASKEDRDGMVDSGMEFGALEGWSRLEEELARMQSAGAALAGAADAGVDEYGVHPEDLLEMSRTVHAPRALVFAAITEPEHLMHWWGPKGSTMKVAKVELRPGGMFHYAMVAPQGEMWGRFIFGAVQPPELLEYVNAFSDADAGITRHPLAPTWPAEVHNIWRFSEAGDSTIIHMRAGPINASEEERALWRSSRDSVKGGVGGSFSQLDAYLATLHPGE